MEEDAPSKHRLSTSHFPLFLHLLLHLRNFLRRRTPIPADTLAHSSAASKGSNTMPTYATIRTRNSAIATPNIFSSLVCRLSSVCPSLQTSYSVSSLTF